MNTHKSQNILMTVVALQLLTVFIPILSFHKKNHKKTTEVSFADVAVPMTIAGAALGLFGATCLYGDVTEKTSYATTIDHAAQSVYNNCYDRYASMIHLMRDTYLLPSVRHKGHQKNFKVGVSENVLYRLASHKRGYDIDFYCNRLHDDVAQLQYHHNQVLLRANELRYQKTYGFSFSLFDAEELRTLEYLSRDLIQLSINLETLCGCLNYNHAYFALYDAEDTIWTRYSDELAGLYNKNYSYDALVDHVRTVLWNKNLTSYAYDFYCSQLTQDVTLLEHTLAVTPHYYVDRLGAAKELQNQLDFLYGVVLAHR